MKKGLLLIVCAGMLVTGCGLQKQNRLGADDIRFAAFYSDYLARSGTVGGDDTALSPQLTAEGLDTLFARHGLDRRRFDARLQAYSRDPELWRSVLEKVRANLRSKP